MSIAKRIAFQALRLAVLASVCLGNRVHAQKAWFVDGYHGGIYGHYPDWNTRFMVDTLKQHPAWKISLEIEPETWDSAKTNDPLAYAELRELAADQSPNGRIEFVNPTYAQAYLWNITGESIIRQFQFGIKKVREHFPNAAFATYASEEPCFTSALPGILSSLGYKFAVLKNPDTCWGGYMRAFGGERVNWIGPDGTSIQTVPRYAIEALQSRSTWQTIAWNNSQSYLDAARRAGIEHPVGMCLQDAGWKKGPWLGDPAQRDSEYVTWRGYFQNVAVQTPVQDWNLSQEDVHVSLVWGSQVLQKLAQQVRSAENRLILAEKMASLAHLYAQLPYPSRSLDEAWRSLMLAEHHDCWIVPYNGRAGNTWADKVSRWTATTQTNSAEAIEQSVRALEGEGSNTKPIYVRVFNALGVTRTDLVTIPFPSNRLDYSVTALNDDKHEIPAQLVSSADSGSKVLVFRAKIPPLGFNTFQVQPAFARKTPVGARATLQQDGTLLLETDLYLMVLDPAKGGIIRSLKSKTSNRKEYVDANSPRAFNEIRGRFHEGEGQFRSRIESPAAIKILENGPVRLAVEVSGKVGNYPFTEIISVVQGQRRIDFNLRLDWVGNPGIGSLFGQNQRWLQEENQRAFYDDRDKLLVLFPSNLKAPKVFKNAPFDVTESTLTNTFFTTWDGIKNNIILQWMDVVESSGNHGLAILTDHTTSYVHGTDHPPGLVLQYSGLGLWGRRYGIAGPSTVHYAIIPHVGRWDKAGIPTESAAWNEPLLVGLMGTPVPEKASRGSILDLTGTGWEITSMTVEGKSLLLRLFNAEGDAIPKQLALNGHADSIELVTLAGTLDSHLSGKPFTNGRTIIPLSIPRFGFRTLKIDNFSPNKE